MEIFRTDGSGRCYADERLFRLLSNVEKYSVADILYVIERIEDHKGDLEVHLNTTKTEVDYIFSVFYTFWWHENEINVTIYYNNEIIKTNKI